jgi:hypothetical protein
MKYFLQSLISFALLIVVSIPSQAVSLRPSSFFDLAAKGKSLQVLESENSARLIVFSNLSGPSHVHIAFMSSTQRTPFFLTEELGADLRESNTVKLGHLKMKASGSLRLSLNRSKQIESARLLIQNGPQQLDRMNFETLRAEKKDQAMRQIFQTQKSEFFRPQASSPSGLVGLTALKGYRDIFSDLGIIFFRHWNHDGRDPDEQIYLADFARKQLLRLPILKDPNNIFFFNIEALGSDSMANVLRFEGHRENAFVYLYSSMNKARVLRLLAIDDRELALWQAKEIDVGNWSVIPQDFFEPKAQALKREVIRLLGLASLSQEARIEDRLAKRSRQSRVRDLPRPCLEDLQKLGIPIK